MGLENMFEQIGSGYGSLISLFGLGSFCLGAGLIKARSDYRRLAGRETEGYNFWQVFYESIRGRDESEPEYL